MNRAFEAALAARFLWSDALCLERLGVLQSEVMEVKQLALNAVADLAASETYGSQFYGQVVPPLLRDVPKLAGQRPPVPGINRRKQHLRILLQEIMLQLSGRRCQILYRHRCHAMLSPPTIRCHRLSRLTLKKLKRTFLRFHHSKCGNW